jgi:hypothetical protein
MKDRDAGCDYVKGITLAIDIQIVSLCEADDSLLNAAYLITA